MTSPYGPQTWVDGPVGGTPISAARLTHVESGIVNASMAFNVQAYGAKGDGQRIRGVTSTSTSPSVTFTSASFTSADVGKKCVVYSDTAAGAITTIASVQSTTSITLAVNAGVTVSGTAGYFLFGTDDSAAFTAAFTAAALDTSVDTTVGPNQPQGTGQPLVVAPLTTADSLYVLASAVTVPSGVMLDCAGMLANLTSSLTGPVVTFSPYKADVHVEKLVLWHVGKSSGQIGLNLLGYGFLLDLVWMKGGGVGINHNAGSDFFCNRAFIIGAHVGISMSQSNQVRYSGIILDSCGEVGGGYSGVVLDNACSDVHFEVQAFEVTGITRSLDNVVLVGNGSTNKSVVLRMKILAEKTGGNVLNLNQAQDVEADVLASNTASNSSGGNNLTTAVVFGTVAGSMRVDAELNSSVTPYSGTVPGLYRYTRGGVEYVVQGGSAPTGAAQSGNGTSPPAVTVTGNDGRGKVSFGSGASPAAGNQVTVTFASNNGWVAAPFVSLTPLNAATAALQPYVTSVSATAFTVAFGVSPTASQSAGTYQLNYGTRG